MIGEEPTVPSIAELFGDPAAVLGEMEAAAERAKAALLSYNPLDLLAYFYSRFFLDLNAPKGKVLGHDPIVRYQFALEYLHAVLAGAPPSSDEPAALTAERGEALLDLLDSLHTVTMRYCMARAHTSETKTFGSASSDVEYRAQSNWVTVRGHRYQALEGEFFHYVLAPHNEELTRQHGVGAAAIADGIQSAADTVRFGFKRARAAYDECMKRVEALRKEQRPTLEEAVEKLSASDSSFSQTFDEAFELADRAAFCNLTKYSTLPDSVLSDLRFERGGNSEFFAEGPYRGTPLRTLPARLKPLVQLDGQSYAIDGQFMRDSAYRAIQRGLLTRNPAYRNEWNTKQKQRAETAILDLLDRHLVGAFTATEVFYPDPNTGQWVETDLVVILDDVLLVLEAKAGVTAMDNPATDFDRHARAIQGLVLDAYRQASRFIRYLKSKPSVPIYRKGASGFEEIRQVNLSAMRLVLPIGLTLENFSPFSTMCKELPGYGPIEGKYPFISISVDDLLVLRRLLPSASALFHYLSVRQAVAGMPGAELFDEIDHLGAYITHNRFDLTLADQLKEADGVWWDQFSECVDKFFAEPDWERKPVPQQKFPSTVAELLNALDTQRPMGFLRCSSLIRDIGGGGRGNLEKTLLHLTRRGREVPVMGMLAGGSEPIQIWGMSDIAFAAAPEVARRSRVGCIAAKQTSVMTICFEVDSTMQIGRLLIRRTSAPSVIEADYPLLLAEGKAMEGRYIAFKGRK